MAKKVEQAAKEKLRNFLEEKRRRGDLKLPPERELSKLFDVSRITVSKVLSQFAGEGLIIRKQGSGTYIAENERLASSLTVGIGFGTAYNPQWSSYSKIIDSLCEHAAEMDVDIQIFDRINEQFERSGNHNNIIKSIEAEIVDAFIIAGTISAGALSKINSKVPTVVLNSLIELKDVVSVSCNYLEAALLATEYLIECGHKNIVFVIKDDKHPHIANSISGFKLALRLKGIEFSEKLIFNAGRKSIDNIISFYKEIGATAVLALHDRIAEQVFKKLVLSGTIVPDDVSLMGVGNFDNREALKLSTIDTCLYEGSAIALNLVKKMYGGGKPEQIFNILEPALVERDSVRKI